MSECFRFGLEAEFMLAAKDTYRPLWYKDVSFEMIDSIFTNIGLDGIPSLEGLSAEPPHKKLMPFIVEGYGIPDADFNIIDAFLKGIEIRTPVCSSLEEVFSVYETLYRRVKSALGEKGLVPVAISHHPIESKFKGPQNKRRHDFWLWAMEVMTTYGPDINVSFPKDITDKLFSNVEDLQAKVNYYAPALAAISLASPFFQGRPWSIKGMKGKSYRTFKRSVIAPAIELHPDENFRIEFKVFEMSKNVADFEIYFLLVLSLFLNDKLSGRASDQERIYDSGAVSQMGLGAPEMRYRFVKVLEGAFKVLPEFGFNPAPLEALSERIELNLTPADEMLRIYDETGSINEVMKEFSYLVLKTGEKI